MNKKGANIYEIQADICKVLASPIRIAIINALKDGEKTVSELVAFLNSHKANVSQHLSIMKGKGILNSRRDGLNVFYSIANPKIILACNLMREVLNEILTERGRIAREDLWLDT
jgi:ArsR family transcriptional regulator